MVEKALEVVRGLGVARQGDRFVIIAGIPFGRPGKTNTLRLVRVE
jgi:pyruvate kinase